MVWENAISANEKIPAWAMLQVACCTIIYQFTSKDSEIILPNDVSVNQGGRTDRYCQEVTGLKPAQLSVIVLRHLQFFHIFKPQRFAILNSILPYTQWYA
jgi:hypothetical protein